MMEDWLSAQARARPEGLALVAGGAALSYRELNARVANFAARLAALGVARGARAGLLLPGSVEAVLAVHAVARLGLLAVMLNTRLTAPELDDLLGAAGCALLLCARETAPTVAALRNSPPLLVCVDAGDSPALIALDAVVPAAPAEHYLQGSIRPADPFAILFTSGTSGKPRGVPLSYDNLFASAMASAYRIGVLPDDRWLCVLPLYHVGGLSILMRSCLYGTAVDLWPRFDAAAINAALARDPITLISLVPTMLYRMLEEGGPPPRALRLALLGGAAAPPDLVERAVQRGLPIATTYGLTEASSQVATALPAETARKPGSVGRPLLFTQVRVLDEAGREQPPGVYGEIVVRGPSVMRGYDGQPEATARALRDGWLHTGDIGYLDGEGDLRVVQRRSDLIISGGENIYPAEVEGVLRLHPAVADVAVVGVPSREWGQQVAAAIVPRDRAVTADEIAAFCRARLAGYKQPRRIRIVDELPRTASGKIRRAALGELFAED